MSAPVIPAIAARVGDVRSETLLIALREVRQRMRGRLFRVGTLLILAAVAAAIVIPAVRKGSNVEQVGIVGPLTAPARAAIRSVAEGLGTSARLVREPSAEAGRADLRKGRVTLVLVDSRALLVDSPISAGDTSKRAQLVRAVARTLGVDRAARAAGLTRAQVEQLAHATPLEVTSLKPGRAGQSNESTSTVGLILMFLMLTQYNTWTLMGVMEEKASRVIEVLLATVRPVQLLGGKVLGIGAVVFAQATLVVVFALALTRAVGSDLLKGTGPLLLGSTLLWLLLGYAFYSWLYAAAGSLAERQDQVQTVAIPLTVPILFGYVTALTTISSRNPSTLFRTLAYLPPTAPFAMPVLVGLRMVSWWQFTASAAITVVCTVILARVATAVYRRAVLRTGQRVRLRDVIGASPG